MKTTIAVWDKDTCPIMEKRVNFLVRVHEDVLVEGGFLRIGFGASKIGGGSLEAVIKHIVKSITSAETSALKEKNELIFLGSNIDIHGCRGSIETSGASILDHNVVTNKVECLRTDSNQEKKDKC